MVSCFRAVVAFVISALTGMQGFGQTMASPNAENGKRVFMAYYCYACHGTEGQGGAGPRLVVRGTAEPLIRYVRKPTGTMPPYTSKVISEQDLRDIDAFLRAVPASAPAKDIPLLNK